MAGSGDFGGFEKYPGCGARRGVRRSGATDGFGGRLGRIGAIEAYSAGLRRLSGRHCPPSPRLGQRRPGAPPAHAEGAGAGVLRNGGRTP